MFGVPSWTVPGIVAEVRELKSKEKKETWAYAVKVVAMGGTFETTTKDKSLADKAVGGQMVTASGTFESFNGALKLVLTSLTEMKSEGAGRLNGAVGAGK